MKLSPHKVLTRRLQESLSPEDVLHSLLEGNKRYMAGKRTDYDLAAQRDKTYTGQFPKAVVFACIDSRVPIETVFDAGIGDLFVIRVAGNVISEDVLGSMEFGCKVIGAKLILVLGHERCGAVQGAIEGVKMGNLSHLLEKIRPAIAATTRAADLSPEKEAWVDAVCHTHIQHTVHQIRKRSQILDEMEKTGKIRIEAGFYHLQDGRVSLI